jgi:signal peptidase II
MDTSKQMSRSNWLLVALIPFLIVFLDQVTKQIALKWIQGFNDYGLFATVLHRNPGAMLGMFSDLPPLLRIVSLSTGGVFLIFIYSAIQYLLPKKTLPLRYGLGILIGGIIGNVIDRTLTGSVVDFLIIKTPWLSSAAFNVADILQWVGYGMVVYSLLKYGEELWPTKDDRKQIWVNRNFQMKYIGVLIAIGLCFSIISGVFAFTYLKITISDLTVGQSAKVLARFTMPFLITFGIICFSFLVVLFLVGRRLSHRTAGPIYAFQKYMEDLMLGNDRKFQLRQGDEFTELMKLGQQIRPYIIEKDKSDKET